MNEVTDYLKCLQEHGFKRTEHVLIVALGEKKLQLYRSDSCDRTYPVSCGSKPVSCKQDSHGTPTGLHEVAEKIGDDAPHGMIFKGRSATGQCWQDRQDAGPGQTNFVTTRILRLRGLEPGHNSGPGVDSFDRFIYIHGTNHPEVFPENISHGCLLMLDNDLIELFNTVEQGTHVFISE